MTPPEAEERPEARKALHLTWASSGEVRWADRTPERFVYLESLVGSGLVVADSIDGRRVYVRADTGHGLVERGDKHRQQKMEKPHDRSQ